MTVCPECGREGYGGFGHCPSCDERRIRELETEVAARDSLLEQLSNRAEKAEASRDISIRIASELTIERDALKARAAELEGQCICGRPAHHPGCGCDRCVEPLAAIERGEREEC